MNPLLTELTHTYSTQHSHITFDVQGGGSKLGEQLVQSEQVDVGMVSGPTQNTNNLLLTPIARDTVAIILNPENELANLSLEELQAIFSGKILNWLEVDGLSASIQVVSRESGSGTRAVFEAAAMGNRKVTPTAIVLPSSQAVVDFVAQNPNAIGYVSSAFLDEQIYAVPIDGTEPVKNGQPVDTYFLTRELALLTPAQSSPEVDQFIEFVLSPDGQEIVAEHWGVIKK